jgi:hypothetical protein
VVFYVVLIVGCDPNLQKNMSDFPHELFFFELKAFTLSPLHQPYFCEGFFKIGSHRTICPGWLQIVILLISVSLVARITDVSHWLPAMST